jgi:hypothetical protein
MEDLVRGAVSTLPGSSWGASSVNNPTRNPCESITWGISSSFASFVKINRAESGLGDALEVGYRGNGS